MRKANPPVLSVLRRRYGDYYGRWQWNENYFFLSYKIGFYYATQPVAEWLLSITGVCCMDLPINEGGRYSAVTAVRFAMVGPSG